MAKKIGMSKTATSRTAQKKTRAAAELRAMQRVAQVKRIQTNEWKSEFDPSSRRPKR